MDSLESLMEQVTVGVEALGEEIVESPVSGTTNPEIEQDLSDPSVSGTTNPEIEENTQEESNSGDPEPPAADAFDEALRRALAERDATIAVQQRQIAAAELVSQAPKLMAFEDLNEDGQTLLLDEASRAGVDVQTVLYSIYREQVAKHQQRLDSLEGSIASQQAEAKQRVREFIVSNEHVAVLPDNERQAFIASIGQLEAIDAIDALHASNPSQWARAVIDIARREIIALAARGRVARNERKAHSEMKSTVSSGKSAPSQKVQSTPSPFGDLDLSGSSWDKRLRASP